MEPCWLGLYPRTCNLVVGLDGNRTILKSPVTRVPELSQDQVDAILMLPPAHWNFLGSRS
jgi:hypothetical protein